MSERKNIVCDACGRSHLEQRFHLPPDLDLCVECAGQIKDGNLPIPYMKKFILAARSLMKFTYAEEEVPLADWYHAPVPPNIGIQKPR